MLSAFCDPFCFGTMKLHILADPEADSWPGARECLNGRGKDGAKKSFSFVEADN